MTSGVAGTLNGCSEKMTSGFERGDIYINIYIYIYIYLYIYTHTHDYGRFVLLPSRNQ